MIGVSQLDAARRQLDCAIGLLDTEDLAAHTLAWAAYNLLFEMVGDDTTRKVIAVMPNSVARLVFRAVVVVLGKVRAANLLQMVVFGEIGSDQEDGCEGEPGKQI